MLVLHAESQAHTYNVCVHSVLNSIVHPLLYVVHHVHAAKLALSHTYFDHVKLKLSAAYTVIVPFAVNVHAVGVPLTVGFVKSTFAVFD